VRYEVRAGVRGADYRRHAYPRDQWGLRAIEPRVGQRRGQRSPRDCRSGSGIRLPRRQLEFVRNQFPGNISSEGDRSSSPWPPPDRSDRAECQPSPNLAGTNNFSGNYLTGGGDELFLDKGRLCPRRNDRFSGWYINEDATPNNTSVFPDPAADSQTFSINNHHYGYGSWFHMFGPNIMNDLSATYTYRTGHALSFGLGGDYPSKLGLQGVPEAAFPRFAPSGFSALGSAQQERRQYPIKTVTVLDNLSWVLGRHALRFGFQRGWSPAGAPVAELRDELT
jgi:hypothetical protein